MTTVLVVDDQLHLCRMYRDLLERHGYRVLTAFDGEAAVTAARQETPDVILLDHAMPRRSGLEVARELKSDPLTSAIPIVMMTAMPYGALGRRAMAAGCDGYLTKPCGPRRVLFEVERHTRTA